MRLSDDDLLNAIIWGLIASIFLGAGLGVLVFIMVYTLS
jgi:hypothetical protein